MNVMEEMSTPVGADARRAGGLPFMPKPLLLQLCEAAPHALAMAQRLSVLEWKAEPANVVRFPDGLPTGPRQP